MNALTSGIEHRIRGAIVFLLLLVPMTLVQAVEELNTNEEGVMLHGYDPVSYHLDQQPQMGDTAYQAEFQGGVYYFSTSRNRDLFNASQARYAPAYGGFCSYGVRVGKKFDIDPLAWKIVDEVLYLQLDQGTHVVWDKDVSKNITIANWVWPRIRGQLASDLAQ